MVRSLIPLTGEAIAEALLIQGVKRSDVAITMALSNNPETYVHVRKSGFMARATWQKLHEKWFLATEDIVEAVRNALSAAGHPLSLDDFLAAFGRAGWAIYGEEPRITLGGVLSQNRGIFRNLRRNGSIWTLRIKPEDIQQPRAA